MRLLKLLLVVLVCAAAVPAVAEPFENGALAYARGDYVAAAEWYQQAAEQGDSRAQYNLGIMYTQGQGVPQDDEMATSWLRKAAEQGDARAQASLAANYATGRGVRQDYAAAAAWCRMAAEQGDAYAQNNLGIMYTQGQGAPQDYVQAYMWFNLAASRHDASEKEKRERAIKNRDLVAAKMTPAQIAEAQKLAREWKPKPER